MYNTKSELYCKLWTSDDLIYQCRFISCYECTSFMGMLITREFMGVKTGGLYEKSLYLFLCFAITLSCLKNKISILLKIKKKEPSIQKPFKWK